MTKTEHVRLVTWRSKILQHAAAENRTVALKRRATCRHQFNDVSALSFADLTQARFPTSEDSRVPLASALSPSASSGNGAHVPPSLEHRTSGRHESSARRCLSTGRS